MGGRMSGQRLQNLAVSAPAFFGINTEESPIGMNPNFADVADNCVIDKLRVTIRYFTEQLH
jgi:hypothetical protein